MRDTVGYEVCGAGETDTYVVRAHVLTSEGTWAADD